MKSIDSRSGKFGRSKNSSFLTTGAKVLGGLTILEFAAVGAAAYVVWTKRDEIQKFMKEHGVKIPEILSQKVEGLLGLRGKGRDQGMDRQYNA